ncbi:M28 family peptidase [Namhaeicola litoreus]|uniref:M28 family peptidase n=1 Tax=Namhaeicola litoreus TaxID=1052145 RepID=A0ABW3Y4M9_9FLAO
MKIKYLLLFASGLLLFNCSVQKNTQAINIDQQALINGIRTLSHDSLEGRNFASVGNKKGQLYLAERFQQYGIEPLFESGYIQSFPELLQGRARQMILPIENPAEDFSNVPDTLVYGGNVLAKIPGKTNQVIVISAHHDHLGIQNGEIYNGADDDASGAAALPVIANYFKNKTPQHTLIFAEFDAEEKGSYGAKYFLNNFPETMGTIKLNINLDMVSRNEKKELYACGTHHYPYLKAPIENLTSSVRLVFGHDDPANEAEDWTESSDHRVFHNKGIPFIYFGVEDHEDYHTPKDDFENIDQQFYIGAVTLIVEAIEKYDRDLID